MQNEESILIQDVTFTIDMNKMTKARYTWLMALVKDIGTGDVNTFTHIAGNPEQELTEDHHLLMRKFYE